MKEVLRKQDVIELLGISMRNFELILKSKQGPDSIRIGKLVFFKKQDVEAWLEAQKRNLKAPKGGAR